MALRMLEVAAMGLDHTLAIGSEGRKEPLRLTGASAR